MTSSWMTYLVVLAAVGVVTAQEFTFLNDVTVIVREGQAVPLVLQITRSGALTNNATVTLVALEYTDNYNEQWRLPVEFLSGEATRLLPLGTLDDTIQEPDRLYIFEIVATSAGNTIGARPRVYVSYVDNDGPALFNCNAGDACQNGATCDPDTGECNCQGTSVPTAFRDCRLQISQLDTAMCSSVTCGQGGVCVNDGKATCVCQPGYVGDTCQLKQSYNVVCYATRMCLNVDPPVGYTGERYVFGFQGVSQCSLKDVTSAASRGDSIPSTWTGSYICLNHVDSICGNVDTTTEADRTITRARKVMIRQNSLRTKNDIIFTSYCRFDSSGTIVIDQTNISPNSSGIILVNRTNNINAANVFIADPVTGKAVTTTGVNVGEVVCFAFVIEATGYTTIRLDSVTANDQLTPATTFGVLADGCPITGNANVVSRLPYQLNATDARRVDFCINAFSFRNSFTVGFRFQLSFCTAADSACNPYTCSGNRPSYGRKKRASGETTEILETTIVIKKEPTTSAITGGNTEPPSSSVCELTSNIVAALATLGVLAAILMIVTLIIVLRSVRSRDNSRDN
ncbi:EGF-like domain-containing protein 2 [Haliotis rubra]|uniref:EGF-like domain-containing protein 2 n=1 Tax=Haliotis rubra TaxID=36100 RepID=UPI001EE53AC5|nr:EGF-like domain-containing protein 2 [Haliotis rubra]XP_046574895.1 EGF-like domain-containing protein 2 [Haliotis rubra]